MPGSFIDTNVILYLAAGDALKAGRAERLLHDGGTTSVQVLNEIAHVARRKMRLSWADTRAFLDTIGELLTIVPVTLETHQMGLRLAERQNLSTYDAMIVAAALQAKCATLWSEDMKQGLVIDKRLRIENPLR
jgi:predicted nucleic acid-binding protein